MRRIDADALKNAILEHCRSEKENLNHFWYDENIIKLIDNAPTVELEVKEVPIATVTFDTEKLKELTNDIVERIKNGELVVPRPKGEWIDVPCKRDLLFNTGIKYTCSVCEKFNSNGHSSFCPNCGAEMRKENDNGKS